MNIKTKSVLLLVFLFLFAGLSSMDAQYYGKKKKKKKKPAPKEKVKEQKTSNDNIDTWAFKDRLWYGGGFNLGFSGSSNFSLFQFGLSPMVGYKIIDQWSVGPRLGFNYSYIKGNSSNGRQVVIQPFDFEAGLFTRFKIIPIIFAHAEFSVSNEQQIFVDQFGNLAVDQDDVPITERQTLSNFYLGLGYNSDSEIGYEFLVLFNLLQDQASSNLPFSIRAGFNFRF